MSAALASAAIERGDRRFGWLMAAPSLLALMLVILFPVLFTLYTSAFDFTLIQPKHDVFVGLDHYSRALGNAEFGQALWVTLWFVAAVVILEFVVGFTVALMLNTVERGKNVYYAILLFPLLMNPVVVGLIWRMFLHPVLGIVNYLLSLVGIGAGQLAGRSAERVLDARHGRHLAPGVVHDRAAARRALGPAARALRGGAHGGRLDAPDASCTSPCR